MKHVNTGTKKHSQLVWTWEHCNKGNTIEAAYKTMPSDAKRRSFSEILYRAMHTEGYNHDLKVVAASTYSYSTMYSYTHGDITHVVYDTKDNVYVFEVWGC